MNGVFIDPPIFSDDAFNKQQFPKIDEKPNAFENVVVVVHLLRW
jgi:hypothetical protein